MKNKSLLENFLEYLSIYEKGNQLDIVDSFIKNIYEPLKLIIRLNSEFKQKLINKNIGNEKDINEYLSDCLNDIITKKLIPKKNDIDYKKQNKNVYENIYLKLKEIIFVNNDETQQFQQKSVGEIYSYLSLIIKSILNTDTFKNSFEKSFHTNLKTIYENFELDSKINDFEEEFENAVKEKLYLKNEYLKEKYKSKSISNKVHINNIVDKGNVGLKNLLDEIYNIIGFLPDLNILFNFLKENIFVELNISEKSFSEFEKKDEEGNIYKPELDKFQMDEYNKSKMTEFKDEDKEELIEKLKNIFYIKKTMFFKTEKKINAQKIFFYYYLKLLEYNLRAKKNNVNLKNDLTIEKYEKEKCPILNNSNAAFKILNLSSSTSNDQKIQIDKEIFPFLLEKYKNNSEKIFEIISILIDYYEKEWFDTKIKEVKTNFEKYLKEVKKISE